MFVVISWMNPFTRQFFAAQGLSMWLSAVLAGSIKGALIVLTLWIIGILRKPKN